MLANGLKNIQSMFPLEVTSAYLAIQGILQAQGFGRSEEIWPMAMVVVFLAVVNIVLYTKVKKMHNPLFHVFITIGFIIWVINVDTARYEDFPYIGRNIEIISPVSLVLYTTVSGLMSPEGVEQ